MIGDTTNTAEYVGNDSTETAYEIPFRFDDPSWLVVIATDENGVAMELELTIDYLLAGSGPAGTGTFTTIAAIPDTSTLTVYREAPGLQTLNLETGEPLPSASMEGQLDRLAMAVIDRVTSREFLTFSASLQSPAWAAITGIPEDIVYLNVEGSLRAGLFGGSSPSTLVRPNLASLVLYQTPFGGSVTIGAMMTDSVSAHSHTFPDVTGTVGTLPPFADTTAANAVVSVGDAWWDTTLNKARVRLS